MELAKQVEQATKVEAELNDCKAKFENLVESSAELKKTISS